MKPISALVIVDVQNDFISGSLALHSCPANHRGQWTVERCSSFTSTFGLSGEEVVPVINQVIHDVNFDVVAYTYDWHPTNHISFYENRHLRKAAPESPVSSRRSAIVKLVSFCSTR